jgi:hypothetical protein
MVVKRKKKKVKERIKKGVKEIKEKVAELEQLEEALEEIEGGIFDDDLEHVEEIEDVSDFDIGSTMLTAAPAVESWAGQNLEDTISRERVERDWEADDEFAGGDVYNPNSSSGDVYGVGSDAYSTGERGEGVYGAAGDGVYKSDSGEGSYGAQGGSGSMKSYADVEKKRQKGRSMLEIAGFEDKDKDSHRDSHGLIKYQASGKNAA